MSMSCRLRVVDETFTIDELAVRTGVKTRTIRQYQTAGLVAPPERQGRVGFYGAAHVERLAAIGRLQDRGYSLAAMRDLFDSWARGRPLTQIIGGPLAHPQVPVDETAVILTEEQLLAMLPALSSKKLRSAAVRAGLITAATKGPNGRCVVCAPSAIAIVADLIDAGISAGAAVALHGELHAALDRVGERIAETVASIEPSTQRIDLLRRNRAALGRTAASTLIGAIGRALSPSDADQIRIGAIRDAQTR